MIVFAASVRAFFALVPHQAIVRIVTGTIIRTATLAKLPGLTIGPVFRGFRNRVNLGAGFSGTGSNWLRVSSECR